MPRLHPRPVTSENLGLGPRHPFFFSFRLNILFRKISNVQESCNNSTVNIHLDSLLLTLPHWLSLFSLYVCVHSYLSVCKMYMHTCAHPSFFSVNNLKVHYKYQDTHLKYFRTRTSSYVIAVELTLRNVALM